jgi:hypothetical protein
VAAVIYGLCALTSLLCAWLLLRTYRERNIALLFWCGLFFAFQACNNFFLIFDKLVFPDIDLSVYRYTIALVAICMLLYGLIMKAEVD